MLLIAFALIVIVCVIGVCICLQVPIALNSYSLAVASPVGDIKVDTHLGIEIQLLEKQVEQNQLKVDALELAITNKDEYIHQLESETKVLISDMTFQRKKQITWFELFIFKQQLRYTTWQQIQKNFLTQTVKKGLLIHLKDELNDLDFTQDFLTKQEADAIKSLGINILNSKSFSASE